MLKPVDLQTMLPHSLNVQRIQELRSNRTTIEQQQFSKEMLQQAQTRQNQVQKGEAVLKDTQIRHNDSEDEERKRQLRYRRNFKKNGDDKKKQAEEEKSKLDEQRGNHIDIKI